MGICVKLDFLFVILDFFLIKIFWQVRLFADIKTFFVELNFICQIRLFSIFFQFSYLEFLAKLNFEITDCGRVARSIVGVDFGFRGGRDSGARCERQSAQNPNHNSPAFKTSRQ